MADLEQRARTTRNLTCDKLIPELLKRDTHFPMCRRALEHSFEPTATVSGEGLSECCGTAPARRLAKMIAATRVHNQGASGPGTAYVNTNCELACLKAACAPPDAVDLSADAWFWNKLVAWILMGA